PGVVAGDAGRAADDQLRLARPLVAEERAGVAGAERLALDLPDRLAVAGAQGKQLGLAVLVVVEVHEGVVDHRRGAGAVLALEAAPLALPPQSALEVVGGQGLVPAVPEGGVDALAVGRRCGRSEAVLDVGLDEAARGGLRPEDLAAAGIDAQQRALL